MSDIDWDSVKMKVDSCLECDVDGVIPGDVRSLASMLIETGDNNVDNRAALANSIKAMLILIFVGPKQIRIILTFVGPKQLG